MQYVPFSWPSQTAASTNAAEIVKINVSLVWAMSLRNVVNGKYLPMALSSDGVFCASRNRAK